MAAVSRPPRCALCHGLEAEHFVVDASLLEGAAEKCKICHIIHTAVNSFFAPGVVEHIECLSDGPLYLTVKAQGRADQYVELFTEHREYINGSTTPPRVSSSAASRSSEQGLPPPLA